MTKKLWARCILFLLVCGAGTVKAQTTPLSDLEALRYIASQPDLIAAFGADAAKGRSHYETWGIKEGRKITFEPLNYTASHPDLMAAFGIDEIKAVTHYIQAGFKEGRKVTFDPAIYLALHSDLRAAFGTDLTAAARHYIQWGYKEGRATTGQAVLQVSPSSVSFGSVTQGTSSPVRTVIVANTGNLPLVVSQISLSGTDRDQFSQTNNCSSVAAGSSCTISVTFTPTSAGSKSGSISISHNASGSPSTISLSGTGSGSSTPAPTIVVSPASLSFSQTVNTTSAAQTVTVRNSGNATLTVSGVSLTGVDAGQFSQTNNCSSVAAGSSCTISVTFKPTSAGSKSASISITHNASGGPTSVALSGTGAATSSPGISISPASVNFGSQAVNATSAAQVITVRNIGTGSLVVTSVTGSDTTQFPGSQNCTATSIAANEACSISISFKPSSSGVKTATISITHNASGSPSSVSLTGTGTAAALSMNDLALTLNVLGFSESKATGTVSATGSTSTPVSYSIQTQGTYGVASINSTTGAVTYTVSDLLSSVTATSDRVVVKATAGSDSVTANVNVSLRYDPLLPNQWHLRNTGQYAFSDIRPTPGFDINVASAWSRGYSGSGVKIGIVDSGLEISHEDLLANVDQLSSINFGDNGTNPSPSSGSDHGTMVAGIIAAAGFNAVGGRGIAYRARLRGYNALSYGLTIDQFSRSFGQDARSADNDIFNGSFGGDETTIGVVHSSLPSFSNTRTRVLNETTALRGGKGAVVVMSAGNNFFQNGIAGACENAISFGVSCSLPATGSYKQSVVPIIVGALAADGKKSSYSNSASSIWISAPGGEFGNEASFIGTARGSDSYKPAIISTTTTGCEKYSQSSNALDSRGANPLSSRCQYTAQMNGTSSAAPMVSGTVALMLEANPSLTYRDAAHILALTAKRVDSGFAGVSATLAGATRLLEQGWTTNAAGYSFSNRYGFGAIDASAAVDMARTYTSYLPAQKFIEAPDFLVGGNPDIGSSGVFVPFVINSTATKTEKVFVAVNIFTRNGGASGATCNQIELTSPSGTRSILMNAANGFKNAILDDVLLSSNAFYGENPNGQWKLSVFDWCSSAPTTPTQFSLLKPQEFALVGY